MPPSPCKSISLWERLHYRKVAFDQDLLGVKIPHEDKLWGTVIVVAARSLSSFVSRKGGEGDSQGWHGDRIASPRSADFETFSR